MTAPAPIPDFFTHPSTDKTTFGRSGPARQLADVQKEFVKVLLSMSAQVAAPDVFRRWSCWVAYSVAADVVGTPCEVESESQGEQLEEWRKALNARRDSYERQMEVMGDGWRKKACRLMEVMGEGLEAAQGDFLSPVLEHGLGGTNKWNGQFFTPWNVGMMMGRMAFAGTPKPGWIESINDSCCGCGSLPIAGACGFLEAGGRKEDVLVDVSDIDEGAVCTAFLQCTVLGLACRAQAMDALMLRPHGPVMINPEYVVYDIATRMSRQRAVKAMDEVLRSMREKAPERAQDASEASGGTGGAEESTDAPGSDSEAPTGQTAGAEASEPPTLHEVAAAAPIGAQVGGEVMEMPVARYGQGLLPGFE